MRKVLSSLFLLIFTWVALIPVDSAIAAETTEVVGFEIIAPKTVRANEAFDITVRAIDKDNKKVESYRGSIAFTAQTFGDIVPSPSKSIAFTQEDRGEKKFSKGIVFKNPGEQKINVVDTANSYDVYGETTVMVEAAVNNTGTTSTETVILTTPIKNSRIISDMVVVAGKTRKNSKVVYMLNGKDVGTNISDEMGTFDMTLTGITQDKNILQVSLLDGNNVTIAKSEEILFEKTSQKTGFYNIVVTPSTTLEISSSMKILVEGDAGMSKVNVSLDGSLVTLTETQAGKYTVDTVAPAKAGVYPLSVTMVSELGQTIEQKDVATLNITERVKVQLIPRFTDVKTVIDGQKISFSFTVKDAPADLDKFKIAYGESADSLSKEVMTYSTGKIQGTGGVYSWYIDKLDPKMYTFKIFGAKVDNALIPEFVSEPIIATVGKDSTAVANIENVVVNSEPGKTIMSWSPVECALSYNIYKITPAGDYVLVQNTKEPSYTIFLQSGSVIREDFAVKALCDNGVESPEYARVSSVQTGPGMIAFLIILSGILGAVLLRRRALP